MKRITLLIAFSLIFTVSFAGTKTTYPVRVWCTNCNEYLTVRIPKGTIATEWKGSVYCPTCGVKLGVPNEERNGAVGLMYLIPVDKKESK